MPDATPAKAAVYALGIDTGGTHTDLVLAGEGRLYTHKVPSTTNDLNDGILAGMEAITTQAGVPLSSIGRFVYASTFVTNLFIEGKQAPVGLITTDGFRDVREIGRASRKPDVYDIHWRPAKPLVPRHLRFGARERVDHLGEVLIPLDEASVPQKPEAKMAIAAHTELTAYLAIMAILQLHPGPAILRESITHFLLIFVVRACNL